MNSTLVDTVKTVVACAAIAAAVGLDMSNQALSLRNQVLEAQRDHAVMLFEKAMGMGSYVELEPRITQAQVNCTQYAGGATVCQGGQNSRDMTTIQRFSPTQGVIQNDRDMIPYTITPAPSRSTDLNRQIEPLQSLEPLPSVQNSFGSREREHGTGLLPYGLDDR